MGISPGTNYYLKREVEGSGWTHLHIGKSSFGWCFALNTIPGLGLNSLEAWKNFMRGDAYKVVDEQGSEISKREIVRIITKRHHPREGIPNGKRLMGLARRRADGVRIIGHGKGTWDLVTNKFFNPEGE